MLTVLMECRDQESELAQTLSLLVTAAVEGLVGDVIVLDHGSTDGSSRVADAAGCQFHTQWHLPDVLASARGEWLLLAEPGARPQAGWIEDIAEYMAIGREPARFAPARNYRRPLLQRLFRPALPLEYGFLIHKRQAMAAAKAQMSLVELAGAHRPRQLSSEMIPAWFVAQQR